MVRLRRLGLRVLMLTGDSVEAAAPIARQAGITEVEAGLDPVGKLARLAYFRQATHGDGKSSMAHAGDNRTVKTRLYQVG